jgi:hypothetical protein
LSSIWLNWLNRFHSLPSGKEKRKQLKGRDLRSSQFFPLTAPQQEPSDAPFFHRKYMPHRIYRGIEVNLIRRPCPHLCRGPPSGHVSPIGYFDKVICK